MKDTYYITNPTLTDLQRKGAEMGPHTLMLYIKGARIYEPDDYELIEPCHKLYGDLPYPTIVLDFKNQPTKQFPIKDILVVCFTAYRPVTTLA